MTIRVFFFQKIFISAFKLTIEKMKYNCFYNRTIVHKINSKYIHNIYHTCSSFSVEMLSLENKGEACDPLIKKVLTHGIHSIHVFPDIILLKKTQK